MFMLSVVLVFSRSRSVLKGADLTHYGLAF